jgi:hypothetical protein
VHVYVTSIETSLACRRLTFADFMEESATKVGGHDGRAKKITCAAHPENEHARKRLEVPPSECL